MTKTTAQRIASIGLSVVATLAMLAGVDFLAQPDGASAQQQQQPQWAQQATPRA